MRRFLILVLILQVRFILLANNSVQIIPEPSWVLPVKQEAGRNPELKDISNGFYYDLMDRQINLVNQSVYQHYIRHIVNESGVQDASEVSINFSPQFQHIVFHKVLIIRDGKSVNQLQAAAIKLADEESNASAYEYNGIKRAYLILKDVQKGDLIDVSFSIVGFNPVFGGRYSGEFYFSSATIFANYYLSILAKPDQKLCFQTFNRAPLPDERNSGGIKIYQWKNPTIVSGSGSANTPSWFTSDPYVSVSEFSNWNEVVDWGLKIFNHYDYRLPQALLLQMDLWRKIANGDPDRFTNLALRFVQDQVRYLGLEMGTNTHQPHTPESVFNQRFGDCKDKALLLTAILQHEHINAFVALANTEEKGNLAHAAPTPLAFNHAIVAIPRSSGFIFVDPTLSLQRGELINSYIPAYGLALVLKPGENQLLPVEPGFLNYISVVEELRTEFKDTSTLMVVSKYKGGAADEVRNNLSSSSRQEISDGYLQYYTKLFDGIQSASPIESSDDSLKNELMVKEFYKIPSLWHKNDLGKLVMQFDARLISLKIPDPISHTDTVPISLEFPFTEEYTMKMAMPEYWPLEMKELHIRNDSYQFDFTPLAQGEKLSFKYYFKTFRDFIPASDIKQYKTDYQEIDKCLSIRFTWNDLSAPAPGTKENPGTATNINWITLWFSFFFCVLFTILFRFLDKRSKPLDQRSDAALPLGGWVMFLGVTIILRLLVQLYLFWNEHFYSKSTWVLLEQAGGANLHSLFILELFIFLFSIAGAGSLIYWFFRRRDIFPSMFVLYTAYFLGAQFIILLFYQFIKLPAEFASQRHDLLIQFFRTFFYAAIWTTFVLRSENVKHTFVYPRE